MGLLCSLLVLGTCAVICAEDKAQQNTAQRTKAESNLNAIVRDILQHELHEQANDRSLWCYRKLQEKAGKQQLSVACQIEGAEIDRLMVVNGKSLNEKQKQLEDQRIEKLLRNREQLKKQKQQQLEDAKQATNLLKLIPEAFVFQQAGKVGDRVTLKFTPNPAFRPTGYSAQVFHHMEGTLTLDLKQKRLVEISGQLKSDVKFGGGLLGHLDKGGTFLVKQQEVGLGCWEMTLLDVRMNGKALFFKSIAVRTKEVDTDFRPVPAAATMQQVATLTNEPGDNNVSRAQR